MLKCIKSVQSQREENIGRSTKIPIQSLHFAILLLYYNESISKIVILSAQHVPDTIMTTKPSTSRSSSSSSSSSSTVVPRTPSTSSHFSLKAALKKPFQGWTKEALWAREGLDDDYNFPHVKRRGDEGMPELNVRRQD